MELKHEDLLIQNLGKPAFDSPLKLSKIDGDFLTNYVEDHERVLYNNSLCKVKEEMAGGREPLSLEKAGPRERIFFDPSRARAGIVTCGGLCPGINDVIRGLVMQLHFWYGVKNIYGFRYGYLGMVKESGLQPMVLDPDAVSEIHQQGGTILGSSRGPQDVGLMVDRLMDYKVNILFCIGGDGTLRGAAEIHEEITKRGLAISVIGIPKTIDNDIGFIEKTFGFETAFTHAVDSIRTAHVEARGYQNGVGLVKLMGRQSGYITANASIASQDVNFCLIPEIPIDLEGENGFYKHLLDRIQRKNHAVIVVAEGVGDRFCSLDEKDVSGNRKSGDIGIFLREGIGRYFKERKVPVALKYIDPSYIIRSSCAIPSDSIFCNQLAQNAVHAGMAGKTGMLVGIWNNCFTHVPIDIAIRNRKFIDPESMFWLNVLETTGQPRWMQNIPRVTG
ncbi:MAG: diphosphate--fructose-6-phosphate 1-phosphotransferase [Candidatus Riflebacteria bacterium HGW-Riflebacteria-1]|jgi:6-phosphofructokinase 1|nr:MAG: diphosphate--fructose-6-phosphate 1-phosphotransferase [Candidatus Riflebacteria bacterium HGW-Riflebacteria-1]